MATATLRADSAPVTIRIDDLEEITLQLNFALALNRAVMSAIEDIQGLVAKDGVRADSNLLSHANQAATILILEREKTEQVHTSLNEMVEMLFRERREADTAGGPVVAETVQ